MPATGVPSEGGATVVLSGDSFGPPKSSGQSLLQWVRFEAPGGVLRDVDDFTVVSHDRIEAVLPAGLGSNLPLVVSVADQRSALGGSTGSSVFSYSTPTVASVSPSTADTTGLDDAATAAENRPLAVRVQGNHFGV